MVRTVDNPGDNSKLFADRRGNISHAQHGDHDSEPYIIHFHHRIALRFLASDSLKQFFSDGWNLFDLSLVLVGYIPETMFENASAMMALRVLRVFRVLRLLRAAKEMKVIVSVLLRSTTAMFYNVLLFGVFIYLFSIIGVGLFKLPDPATLQGEEKESYEKLMEIAPHSPSNSPDPFGTLGEAMFTLFRELTGEDWTDLRYNQYHSLRTRSNQDTAGGDKPVPYHLVYHSRIHAA